MIPTYLNNPEEFKGKLWGKIKLSSDGKSWILKGHPHMIIQAKRLFPGSWGKRDRGYVKFPISKRYIGELNWFMMRFPLKIEDLKHWESLLKEAQEHYVTQEKLRKYKPKTTPSHHFYGELRKFQKEGLSFLLHNTRSLLADEMGLGKGQPLNSKVLTPNGWKKMGNLTLNDSIIGSDGKSKKVVGIFPQGIKRVYKVTFTDNHTIECDENHIWAVRTANQRFYNSYYRHLTLKEIIKKGVQYKNGNRLHFIPMVVPIKFKKKKLPLHPYVLGCLLGDGCLCMNPPLFSTSDKELITLIKKHLNLDNIEIVKRLSYNDYDYIIRPKRKGSTNSLRQVLKTLDLLGKKSHNKFVPEVYKCSSINDRKQLLQGLLDTDGCVSQKNSHLDYCTVSKQLSLDIKFIIESLGGTAKTTSRIPSYVYNGIKKKGQRAYTTTIALPNKIKPFKLSRKANLYKPRKKYKPYRAIKKIEFVGMKECRCIKVEANDGLYVTEHCILTHNTPVSLAWLTSLNISPPFVIVVPSHIQLQWKSEIKKFLSNGYSIHTIKGLTPYPLPNADIFIVHYLILRGWKDELPNYGFTACIFDEIQELRRSTSEKYSCASLIAESVEHCIGLSGTPIYNYGDEMWNIMNILQSQCLGDKESFRREWCYYDPDAGFYDNLRVKEPELFGEYLVTEGLMLRRRKDDVLNELPPKRRLVQNIDVDTGLFDELIAPAIAQAKKIPSIKDPFERGQESMHAVDQARMATGIAKAHYVAGFVKMLLESGEKLLLYGHHHDVIDIYTEELKEHYPVLITGRQTSIQKDESQKQFMEDFTKLIIVSLRSGIGLNLQKARCVVFGELDWSPAVHSQCEDRAHRIGTKDSVLCYYLTCDHGTDHDMMETLGLKTSQFVSIMGDKAETQQDRILAQSTMKEHMSKIIKTLQSGGVKGKTYINNVAHTSTSEKMSKSKQKSKKEGSTFDRKAWDVDYRKKHPDKFATYRKRYGFRQRISTLDKQLKDKKIDKKQYDTQKASLEAELKKVASKQKTKKPAPPKEEPPKKEEPKEPAPETPPEEPPKNEPPKEEDDSSTQTE